jgi:hypothetical protein
MRTEDGRYSLASYEVEEDGSLTVTLYADGAGYARVRDRLGIDFRSYAIEGRPDIVFDRADVTLDGVPVHFWRVRDAGGTPALGRAPGDG